MRNTKGSASRATLVGVAGAVAAVLGVAGAAWACTISATVSVAPGEGRPGSTVTVEGERFDGTVEIRWSEGDRLLARTSGASFSVAVQIPADAAPGTTYYIVGIGRMADGQVLGKNQAPFHVPATSGSTGTDPDPNRERKTSGTVTGGSRSSEPQTQTTEASSPSNADDSPSPSPTAAGPSSAPASEETTLAARAERPTRSTPGSGAERTQAAAATAKASPPPAAGTPLGAEAPVGAGTAPVVDEQTAAAPSGRSASADVWSGFQSGADAVRGPSLLQEPSASAGESQLAPGIALLSAGLLALGLGTGAAATRRRRAVHAARRR